jgi:hypothetical protein
VELESHLGRGLLAGTGAVEDDVSVSGDDFSALLELVGADTESSGEDERIRHDVQRVTKVDDERAIETGALGVSDHGHELRRLQTKATEFG